MVRLFARRSEARTRMSRDMIRLMQALFLPGLQSCGEVGWCPAADVYRTGDGWLVKFELAGVRPEDMQVTAGGRVLTVSGRRRDCALTAGYVQYQMEIAYSYFERSLELPCNLDHCGIATDYRDGMLHISITETEAEK